MCNFLRMKMTEVENSESMQWTSENASRPKILYKISSLCAALVSSKNEFHVQTWVLLQVISLCMIKYFFTHIPQNPEAEKLLSTKHF